MGYFGSVEWSYPVGLGVNQVAIFKIRDDWSLRFSFSNASESTNKVSIKPAIPHGMIINGLADQLGVSNSSFHTFQEKGSLPLNAVHHWQRWMKRSACDHKEPDMQVKELPINRPGGPDHHVMEEYASSMHSMHNMQRSGFVCN